VIRQPTGKVGSFCTTCGVIILYIDSSLNWDSCGWDNNRTWTAMYMAPFLTSCGQCPILLQNYCVGPKHLFVLPASMLNNLVCTCSHMSPSTMSQQRTLQQIVRPSTAFQFPARVNGLKEYPFVCYSLICTLQINAFSALALSIGHRRERPDCKNWMMRCWRGCLSGARCRW